MQRIYLLRHARAAWPSPSTADSDRPLEPAGLDDAERLAIFMTEHNYQPALWVCSPAQRAIQTRDKAVSGVLHANSRIEPGLYSGDSRNYMACIDENYGEDSIILVGHNPMIEDVALALAGKSSTVALRSGFPPGALAVFERQRDNGPPAIGKFALVAFAKPGIEF